MIVKNCKVLKELLEADYHELVDIHIEGDEIINVYPAGSDVKDEHIVDAGGKYVLPGFIDLHVHLTLSAGDTLVDSFKSPVQMTIDAYSFALDSLKRGFTTLRDVGASSGTVIAVRDSINAGKLVGPNLICSGRIITPTENGNDFFKGMYLEVDSPDDMARGVRTVMKDGADFIKLMGTGAMMNPGGEPGMSICFKEEFEAIVKAAELKGTYVAVHCHGTNAIKTAIKAGCRSIEHSSLMDDEIIELYKAETAFPVPTLSVWIALLRDLPESSKFMTKKVEAVLSDNIKGVKKAYKAGIKFGFGTDQGVTGLFHGDNGMEFEVRKEHYEMDNIDLILQATKHSAEIMKMDHKIGTIKVGKLADLVIVDGDPLDDISVLRNNIETVIKSGQVV
ncbi:amidohydrolase family protein [Acidaminobacter sp. JC074]|uniref:metal-dependent hydrolase family protein n=1 Tax=Acidaminobacter sp. JC074 TaxID=2530199 RepID=UPI001F0DAFF1|nr:amidohydrolase family protein [Acidaminobacter sp. JC074]MCH4887891.1 amidohydrolase family protein [Acidaminobacter sp. JC074]